MVSGGLISCGFPSSPNGSNLMARYPIYTKEQEWLADMLVEWRDAGTPVQDVVYAIDSLIVARLSQVLTKERVQTRQTQEE